MNPHDNAPDDDRECSSPPRDELDSLLRAWHAENAAAARAGRDRLLQALASDGGAQAESGRPSLSDPDELLRPNHRAARVEGAAERFLRRYVMTRYSAIAAAIALVFVTGFLWPDPVHRGQARADLVQVPQGGRLDAVDPRGDLIGPCPLKHTDVNVEIAGRFARVTLRQKYGNPYSEKIEAVYTFPLSHRAAVDRMTLTVGTRVILGEVKERNAARAIYQAAKQAGHVASLLEQERPNIFTQSVANIEPGVDVVIEISYVELLEEKEGEFSFEFPMVVAPRYIPGAPTADPSTLPAGLVARRGVVLLGPAQITVTQAVSTADLGELDAHRLSDLLAAAVPIEIPDAAFWSQPAADGSIPQPTVWHQFEATYADGAKDIGVLYTNGVGTIHNRWFRFEATAVQPTGTGFASNTTQVPDASRITPMPVNPGPTDAAGLPATRAGHDISITVNIDTGGPGLVDLKSKLHEVSITYPRVRTDGTPSAATLRLRDEVDIPNRDFVLSWRQTADTITEQVFTHAGPLGNFITVIVNPPQRVTDAQAVPRELVFVLDTSGSMSGRPIEKAKDVMSRAIAALRPQDTFNMITFAGDTHILWPSPQPASPDKVAEAQQFLASRQGRGGTEMMTAINAALERNIALHGVGAASGALPDVSIAELAALPADGRDVVVYHAFPAPADLITPGPQVFDFPVGDGRAIRTEVRAWTFRTGMIHPTIGLPVRFTGRWVTRDNAPVFEVSLAEWTDAKPPTPLRVVCFMTDGEVGNDMAIIDAVRRNAATTRVFAFGIGNSVNRYLLDNVALAGRGEVEYVLLNDDADAAVQRFSRRIQTPVLTNIRLETSGDVELVGRVPDGIPDLWEQRPIILHAWYARPGRGGLTLRGNAGDGPWSKTIDLDLPESQPDNDVIATLWARAEVERIMNTDLAAAQAGSFPPDKRARIVELGEQFSIMTQFTSFVAVENLRVTVGGEPRLVPVPVELPDGQEWEGTMGRELCAAAEELLALPTQEIRLNWPAQPPLEPASSLPSNEASLEEMVRFQKDSDSSSGVPVGSDVQGDFLQDVAFVNSGDPTSRTLDDGVQAMLQQFRAGYPGSASGVSAGVPLVSTQHPSDSNGVLREEAVRISLGMPSAAGRVYHITSDATTAAPAQNLSFNYQYQYDPNGPPAIAGRPVVPTLDEKTRSLKAGFVAAIPSPPPGAAGDQFRGMPTMHAPASGSSHAWGGAGGGASLGEPLSDTLSAANVNGSSGQVAEGRGRWGGNDRLGRLVEVDRATTVGKDMLFRVPVETAALDARHDDPVDGDGPAERAEAMTAPARPATPAAATKEKSVESAEQVTASRLRMATPDEASPETTREHLRELREVERIRRALEAADKKVAFDESVPASASSPAAAETRMPPASERAAANKQSPVYVEQLLLRIAGMALNGQLEAAAGYAADLAARLPGNAAAAALRDVLANAAITHASRLAQVEVIARRAAADLAERAARIKRMVRKIDEALLKWALEETPDANSQEPKSEVDSRLRGNDNEGPRAVADTPRGAVDLLDDRALVTVLLADASDAAIRAVKEAGLDIESTVPDAKVLVGRVAPDALFAVAALDEVRRVTAAPPAHGRSARRPAPTRHP